MKGFVKILESIIASIIMLTTMTFFFTTTIKQTDWDDALLQIRSQDILAALTLNGTISETVMKSNPNITINALLNPNLLMFPITVDYTIAIKGVPPPNILIGCNCTDLNPLYSLLSPTEFVYKNRTIKIVLGKVSLDDIHNEERINILFLTEYKDLTTYRSKLDTFLRRGGTIFMMSNLTFVQANNNYMNEVFGLKWVTGTRQNTGAFFDPENEENTTTFTIAKYYRNLTSEAASFDFSGAATIAVDNRTVVYGNGLSLAKINKDIIQGRGRTVWLSPAGSTANIQNLTKALVMWGSGEYFELSTKKTAPLKYFKTIYIAEDRDVYEVVLTLWKIFR